MVIINRLLRADCYCSDLASLVNTGEFNCVDLVLYDDDLSQLQKDIEEKDLPSTTGFFFGGDSYDHYDADMQQEDLNIIKNAKQSIKDGYDIVYSCWW